MIKTMRPIYRTFDNEKYCFDKLVLNKVFSKAQSLEKVHYEYKEHIPKDVVVFSGENQTFFHNSFYAWLNSEDGNQIKDMFKQFVKEEINGKVINEPFMYQTFPTIRFHLPGNRAISKWHYDSDDDHRHPVGEKNFIIPLTVMFDSNATWTETIPGKEDYIPISMGVGIYCQFDGNKCRHGNLINQTGSTRVSFDFRVLTVKDYENQQTKDSVTTKRKFGPGGYYTMFDKETITK